ncbi:hypothetical protein STSP2_02200 [Anaerohalosphaera lusitana]|uniref:Glycoside hydrolase 123-like N-terminal domain-containing protein n=1 Tax=Anaerohalosphaera lusitana TaxID=1936003 RepID=A0A1U9NM64_9BACT|nr:glycoside hydrolase domain-containing protein [Anaerohalosphaera lusitana]AQT69021.1 hypothetical protein STSP2_02200 [Anaerohalosphaera lusitana]
MAKGLSAFILAVIWSIVLCSANLSAANKLYDTLEEKWDPEALGNHRAVVTVDKAAEIAAVRIEWRRPDTEPENKGIIVIDERTGKAIDNVLAVSVNREAGKFLFQPRSGEGRYFFYYMPYELTGTYYPKVEYNEPDYGSHGDWLKDAALDQDQLNKLFEQSPKAEVIRIESINEFSDFVPMEMIATTAETEELISQNLQKDFLLFPESRLNPIRMKHDLPLKWIEPGPSNIFQGNARKGEFYVFQIGLFAARKSVDRVQVEFSGLMDPTNEKAVPATAFSSFNTGGISWDGSRFAKNISVEKGDIQPLWIGVQIPKDIEAGTYNSDITVKAGGESQSMELELEVSSETAPNAGDDEPWLQSRLRWLNSRIALDDEIFEPYKPVSVDGRTVSILGRKMTIADDGLLASIDSHFTPEVTGISTEATKVLDKPLKLVLENQDANIMQLESSDITIDKVGPGTVKWTAASSAGPLEVICNAVAEFDGFVGYSLEISSSETVSLKDIRLQIPMSPTASKYMMGLGRKGGFAPDEYSWKWAVEKNQDGAWIGGVNAGLQFSLRDENYRRPLNTNFYQLNPLLMPKSWDNDGKGGCELRRDDDGGITVTAYSGPRTIQPGEKLYYNFNLLITPFKPIDMRSVWNTRFYHSYKPIDQIAEVGANTVNIHHATPINPYINYPFIRPEQMKDYIDQAHKRDMRVKIYYTVRELANRAAELFALRSLGDEIFSSGPGGGYSWLQEHLREDYIAGWYVDRYRDASVVNSGTSRWHNYYLEGLNWLTKNVGIDGIYIDDLAFDRTVMKRLRKILERNRPDPMIDLHSANQFNPRDGFANSANLYLEHFPYIDRLWFGEYFEYDLGPDYWLVEVSGIPFGLTGEMLQDGGNPWRGMIYGMTARAPRNEYPKRLWKVWDEFGIQDSRMLGYWSDNCPVRTSRPDVAVSAFVKEGETMIALASWADEDVKVQLQIDWDELGLDKDRSKLYAKTIEGFQPQKVFRPDEAITVPAGKGWLLGIRE